MKKNTKSILKDKPPTKTDYPEYRYPIDDGEGGGSNSVLLCRTTKWQIRSQQTKLYLFLVRNVKDVLSKCADRAYNLIKKQRNNPQIDPHLVEQMDQIIDETAIDSVFITTKPNIRIALRIFAGYWTPEYIVKVSDDLREFKIKKIVTVL